jgi:hypothetical protein
MSKPAYAEQYFDPGQANPYDLIERFMHGSSYVDRQRLESELTQFAEVNSGIVAQFDQLAVDLIDFNENPESFVASVASIPEPIPLGGKNKYPGDVYSQRRGIELLINQSVVSQSAYELFVRSVNGRFYEPPHFLGEDKPATSLWSLGVASIGDESSYRDFRPPFMIALSMDASQVALVPRLADEAVQDRLDNIRAYDLGSVGKAAGELAERAAYVALLEEVRFELTDPHLTEGAYRALVTELGKKGLTYVTSPKFETNEKRIDTTKLYSAREIAKADKLSPADIDI